MDNHRDDRMVADFNILIRRTIWPPFSHRSAVPTVRNLHPRGISALRRVSSAPLKANEAEDKDEFCTALQDMLSTALQP